MMIQDLLLSEDMLTLPPAMHNDGDITRILAKARENQTGASEELICRVYKELRRVAAAQMRRERGNHTLEPTALVHEVYLRLKHRGEPGFQNRAHFFGAAANLMRQILIDHARRKRAGKRGGDFEMVSIDDVQVAATESAGYLLALDEALERLALVSPRGAKIVELRVFGGLSIDNIANILRVVPRTVDRNLKTAREWLRIELRRQGGTEPLQ